MVKKFCDLSLRNPMGVSLVLPWFFVMLPLIFLPNQIVRSPWADSLVDIVSGFVPMIHLMSAGAVDPQWNKFALTCIWTSGPAWTLVTMILCIRTLKAGIYHQKKISGSIYVGAYLLFGGAIVVCSTIKPRPWKNHDVFSYFFSSTPGMFFFGWFVITSLFVVIGLVSSTQFSRFLGGRK